jgi:membrane dipeptidase
VAAFISIEGAELFGCDLNRLDDFYARGVRALNLCWNHLNALCSEKGLTELGERFVTRCNELGIIIDVSHLRDEAFWDVIRLTTAPVMASHSNSRVICPHKRNLTDEQFKAIIKCRGVAGINMYAHFLGENPDVNTVIRHIEHFLSLGGAENIALGCDFDGCDTLRGDKWR